MVDPHTHGSPQLSIVIPAHNEAGRILPYLRQIIDYCEGQRRSYELLVVDDGSTDGTSLVVGRLAQVHSTVHLLRLPTCHGKGAAVRYGMQSAVGCLQLFVDADGATPIQELARLEKALAGGADMAIGSRALAARLPNFVVHARVHRSVLGCIVQCSRAAQRYSKALPTRNAASSSSAGLSRKNFFAYASIDGFGFDLELLYLAQQRGYRIAEVPVNWSDKPGSKVRVLRDGLVMLRELAVIRRNDQRGRYRLPSLSPELMHANRFRMPAS